MSEVIDPTILSQLNSAGSFNDSNTVRDPTLLSTLNEDPTAHESWYEDPVMASRAALDGLLFGWSDEAGAGVAAGVAKLAGEERPYSEVYGEMMGSLQLERDQYSKDHPVASTALEIAGGIMSPANLVGGRAIMGASQLKTAQKMGVGAGVAAGEGAVYGAGSAQEGERAKGAAKGALLGATTFGVLKGSFETGKKAGDVLSKRRVAQDLGKGDDFIPINLAEAPVTSESGKTTGDVLPWFYREVLGKAFGSRGLIEQQSKRWTRPVVSAVERADTHLKKLTDNANTAVKEMEVVVKKRTLESIDSAKQASQRTKADIKTAGNVVKMGLEADKANILPEKIKQMDVEVNASEAFFRQNAYRDSLPRGSTEKEIAEVASMSAQQAMQKSDSLWSEKGFEVTKNKSFRINPNKVLADIARIFDEDVLASSTVLSSGQPNAIAVFVDQYMQKHVTAGGWMTGEALTQMRSQIGISANALSDAGGKSAALGSVVSAIQDSVDEVIMRQLPVARQAQFAAERKAWAHNRVLRLTVADASRTAGQKGEFTADGWLSNVVRDSPRQARQGTGPLQRQADEVADLVSRRDEVLTQAADQAVKGNVAAQKAALESQAVAINREISRLSVELEEIRRKSIATAAKKRRMLAKSSQIEELSQKLSKLRSQRDVLVQASPKENVTPFERLFANFLVGGGGIPGTLALPLSIPLANVAARQSTQRMVAGQTAGQEAIQRQLQKEAGPDTIKRVISREVGAQ